MPEVAPSPPRGIPPWVKVALPALSILFAALALPRANASSLRGDEVVTLFACWRGRSWAQLVLEGSGGQTSPAPFSYFVDKAWDQSRRGLRYLGLTPPGYARLPAILFTAAFGLAAAFVAGGIVRDRHSGTATLRYLLVLGGLATFYFHPKVFAFASVERPYSLWNGAWLVLLALLLRGPRLTRAAIVLLTLMAGTASAACFQILAVALAFGILRRMEGRPAREILREVLRCLWLPALVGIYYAVRSPYMEQGETGALGSAAPEFVRFWLRTNLHVWLISGVLTGLVLARPRMRDQAIPPLALLALLAMMPAIFGLAHSRGYGMPSRYYIWTTAAVPLAFFFAAAAGCEAPCGRAARALVLVVAAAIVGGHVYATFKDRSFRNDSRRLALLEAGSPLTRLLETERPARLLYEPSLEEIERLNLVLVAEWIETRFSSLPRGSKDVVIRDAGGRLVAEPPQGPAPGLPGFIPGGLRPIPLGP